MANKPVSKEVAVIMAEDIFALMRTGLSLRQSAMKLGTTESFIHDRVRKDPVLKDKYYEARDAMMDKWADDIMTLADDPVEKAPSGATDMGAVNQRRLQIDARKWILSKLAPKKYGEKVEVSSDGTMPAAQIGVIVVPAKSS